MSERRREERPARDFFAVGLDPGVSYSVPFEDLCLKN
jgi:hypothetical protein